MHAFGSRVNRCQVLFNGEFLPCCQQAILGMYHLSRPGGTARFPVATNWLATLKPGLLCLAEMKKSQCQRTGAITDSNQQ